jgi:hypothetical protein
MSPLVRRLLIAVAATTLVVAAVLAGLWIAGGGLDDQTPTAGGAGPPPRGGRPGPPTGGSPGGAVVEPGPGQDVATDPAPVDTPGVATVFVTYAGWDASGGGLEVTGFVSGVVEDGGTCRLTATSGGRTAGQESPGVADATTTSCGTLVIPQAELSPGTWDVVLSYESSRVSGASAPTPVSVTS